MLRVVVCVSGGGTNLQAIIDAVADGTITNTELVGVISNNYGVRALERAEKAGIDAKVVSPKDYENRAAFNEGLLTTIRAYKPDLIVLAGFLVVIPEAMIDTQVENMVDDFARRIQSQGLSMEQYMQFTGATVDSLKEQMKPQAVKRIQSRLVLEKVAEVENIQISDEKLDEELAKMAEMYKMELDKFKELVGEYEKEQMKKDLAVQEAVTLMADSAKEA